MDVNDTTGYWLSRTLRAVTAAGSEIIRAHCAARGKAYVLTLPQWGVLATLAATGEQPISALAQSLAVEAPAVTGIITRLEQIGLVARVHDGQDRRVVQVSLTDEGRDIVCTLEPVMLACNEALLPARTRRRLIQQLRRLITSANQLAPSQPGLTQLASLDPE